MAAPSIEELMDRYATELAPFLRHDDFYGSILLPSLIINKKGCHRALVNRHPTVLFKAWALSSPETAVSLRRKAGEILSPLVQLVLSGERPSAPTDPSWRLVGDSLFRYCVWSGRDRQALDLLPAFGEGATSFTRRAGVLLAAFTAGLRPGWLAGAPEKAHLDGMLGLFLGEVPGDRVIPGETARLSDLYYSFFENASGADLMGSLGREFGDMSRAVEVRSTEGFLVWAFLALASSGRLFWAFRLARQCRRASGVSRSPHFFHEECLRWVCAAERYGLYRLWERRRESDSEPASWRTAEAYLLFGPDHAQRMEELLGLSAQPAGFSLPPDSPEGFLRSCHDRFEEVLLDPPAWFLDGRRVLAAFAGWDLRARVLLALIYEEEDPGEALRHLRADRRTVIVQFRRLRLPGGGTGGRAAKKRQGNLRKMLEESLSGQDPGPHHIGNP